MLPEIAKDQVINFYRSFGYQFSEILPDNTRFSRPRETISLESLTLTPLKVDNLSIPVYVLSLPGITPRLTSTATSDSGSEHIKLSCDIDPQITQADATDLELIISNTGPGVDKYILRRKDRQGVSKKLNWLCLNSRTAEKNDYLVHVDSLIIFAGFHGNLNPGELLEWNECGGIAFCS